jgi:putative hemolysin
MDTVWLEVVLILVAIIANGFFSGSEIAMVSARPSRLAQLRAEGVRGAQRALDLKATPETFLATVQIAITLVGTLASAVGGAAAIEVLTPKLAALPIAGAERWAEPAALAVVIVVITFVSLVIGELAPKALALRNPERIACVVAPVLHVIARLVVAPNRVLTVSTRAVLTLLGQRAAAAPPPVSEEEVKILVQEGAARGIFEHHEAELVRRIFAFTDTPVRSIMTPRPNIRGLDVTMPPAEILRAAAEHERSRLPVFRGSIDDRSGSDHQGPLRGSGPRGDPRPRSLDPAGPLRAGDDARRLAPARVPAPARKLGPGGRRVRPGGGSHHDRGRGGGDRGRGPRGGRRSQSAVRDPVAGRLVHHRRHRERARSSRARGDPHPGVLAVPDPCRSSWTSSARCRHPARRCAPPGTCGRSSRWTARAFSS